MPSADWPATVVAATCTWDLHDRARTVRFALRPVGPDQRRWARRLRRPDRPLDRDLLFHVLPPAATPAGAPPSAPRLAAARRPRRDLGRDRGRNRASEGRRGDGEERRGSSDRAAWQHPPRPQSAGRSQAAVTIPKLHLLRSPLFPHPAAPLPPPHAPR